MYKKTNDGKKGGVTSGPDHEKGGISAVVTDTGQQVELEGGEVIINKEASKKHWKELSEINQSAGGGVPIPPPGEYKYGGPVIDFNRNDTPNVNAIKFARKIKKSRPELWNKYGKGFEDRMFEVVSKVFDRGYWKHTEKDVYDVWKKHSFNLKSKTDMDSTISALKIGTLTKDGYAKMKSKIETHKVDTKSKPGWKHKSKAVFNGGGEIEEFGPGGSVKAKAKTELLAKIADDFKYRSPFGNPSDVDIREDSDSVTMDYRHLGDWDHDYERGAEEHDDSWMEDDDYEIWTDESWKIYPKQFKDWVKKQSWGKRVDVYVETGEKNWAYFTVTLKKTWARGMGLYPKKKGQQPGKKKATPKTTPKPPNLIDLIKMSDEERLKVDYSKLENIVLLKFEEQIEEKKRPLPKKLTAEINKRVKVGEIPSYSERVLSGLGLKKGSGAWKVALEQFGLLIENNEKFKISVQATIDEIEKEELKGMQPKKPNTLSLTVVSANVEEGVIFEIEDGTEFIVDKIEKDPKLGTLVSSSMVGGEKGRYRDGMSEFVDFLNEKGVVQFYDSEPATKTTQKKAKATPKQPTFKPKGDSEQSITLNDGTIVEIGDIGTITGGRKDVPNVQVKRIIDTWVYFWTEGGKGKRKWLTPDQFKERFVLTQKASGTQLIAPKTPKTIGWEIVDQSKAISYISDFKGKELVIFDDNNKSTNVTPKSFWYVDDEDGKSLMITDESGDQYSLTPYPLDKFEVRPTEPGTNFGQLRAQEWEKVFTKQTPTTTQPKAPFRDQWMEEIQDFLKKSTLVVDVTDIIDRPENQQYTYDQYGKGAESEAVARELLTRWARWKKLWREYGVDRLISTYPEEDQEQMFKDNLSFNADLYRKGFNPEYANWQTQLREGVLLRSFEELITELLSVWGEMPRSDAQGIVEANEKQIRDWFEDKETPRIVYENLMTPVQKKTSPRKTVVSTPQRQGNSITLNNGDIVYEGDFGNVTGGRKQLDNVLVYRIADNWVYFKPDGGKGKRKWLTPEQFKERFELIKTGVVTKPTTPTTTPTPTTKKDPELKTDFDWEKAWSNIQGTIENAAPTQPEYSLSMDWSDVAEYQLDELTTIS